MDDQVRSVFFVMLLFDEIITIFGTTFFMKFNRIKTNI